MFMFFSSNNVELLLLNMWNSLDLTLHFQFVYQRSFHSICIFHKKSISSSSVNISAGRLALIIAIRTLEVAALKNSFHVHSYHMLRSDNILLRIFLFHWIFLWISNWSMVYLFTLVMCPRHYNFTIWIVLIISISLFIFRILLCT